jgi:hypothetical protein
MYDAILYQTGGPETMTPAELENDLFTMANLSPLFTGLPFVVWISPRNAPHDIRVKVSPGNKAIPENFVSVALRPDVRVVGGGSLTSAELALLREWVRLNFDTLLAYWEGRLFTEQVIAALRPVS